MVNISILILYYITFVVIKVALYMLSMCLTNKLSFQCFYFFRACSHLKSGRALHSPCSKGGLEICIFLSKVLEWDHNAHSITTISYLDLNYLCQNTVFSLLHLILERSKHEINKSTMKERWYMVNRQIDINYLKCLWKLKDMSTVT